MMAQISYSENVIFGWGNVSFCGSCEVLNPDIYMYVSFFALFGYGYDYSKKKKNFLQTALQHGDEYFAELDYIGEFIYPLANERNFWEN